MLEPSRPELRLGVEFHLIHNTYGTYQMSISLQCARYSKHMIFKGGKRASYAPTKTRINPLVVNCYVPNELGDLVLVKRVRPKAR